MVRAATIAIGLSFRDRDGNRAKATCYCPIAAAEADAWILARELGDRMLALSNAILFEISLTWRYRPDSEPEPPIDSTNQRKILMLVVNEDEEINGIVVPSPNFDIWELDGDYAGIRLDLASAGALGFVGLLESEDLRTDDNRAVGTDLVAGGLAL